MRPGEARILRFIGGPNHGKEYATPKHFVEIPTFEGPRLTELRPYEEAPPVAHHIRTVTYERRVIVSKDARMHYAETCLVPQGMSDSEAWRLIKTLGFPEVHR